MIENHALGIDEWMREMAAIRARQLAETAATLAGYEALERSIARARREFAEISARAGM